MKFTAQASSLLPTLKLAQARAKSGSPIPILGHILLTVDGNRLTATGNDLDASTQAFATVEGGSNGSCAVPAETLVRLVSALPGEAHLSIEADSKQIALKAGKSRYKLPILPASDFPQAFACEGKFSVDLSAADISQLFTRPASAIHRDEHRAILRGCYLHSIDGKLSSVGTDGVHLLALSTEHQAASFAGAIVPLWAAAEIEKVGKSGGKLTIAEATLSFETAEARYFSKLVDGKYPYYQNAVPRVLADYVTIDREEALALVKRLAVLAGNEAEIALSFGDGEIIASIDGLGTGAETIPCSGVSSAYIAVAPHRLVEMLALPKGETIQLHLIDGGIIRIVDPFEPAATIVEATRIPKHQRKAA